MASTLGAAGAASTGGKMSRRTAGVTEFGFRELPAAPEGGGGGSKRGAAADGGSAGQAKSGGSEPATAAAEPGAGPPAESELPAPEGQGAAGAAGPGAELSAAATATAAAPAEAAGNGDSGHLLASPTKPARTGGGSRPPPRAASRPQLHASASGSSLSSLPGASGGGAQGTAATSEAASVPTDASGSSSASLTPAASASLEPAPSAWQRWFGKKQEEAPLLPVPLRVRCGCGLQAGMCTGTRSLAGPGLPLEPCKPGRASAWFVNAAVDTTTSCRRPPPPPARRGGDVKLSALICVSGWVAESPADYYRPWLGIRCVPRCAVLCSAALHCCALRCSRCWLPAAPAPAAASGAVRGSAQPEAEALFLPPTSFELPSYAPLPCPLPWPAQRARRGHVRPGLGEPGAAGPQLRSGHTGGQAGRLTVRPVRCAAPGVRLCRRGCAGCLR